MYQSTGQVLGASTAIGGIAALPYTGSNEMATMLSITAIIFGIIVFSSFTFTRILKRIIK